MRSLTAIAAFPAMMRRDRRREGLRECRAAWSIGVSVRRYREIEGGESFPTSEEWERMVEVFSWPQAFART